MAAKEGKEDFILEHHEEVIKRYSRMAADVKELLDAGSGEEDEILEFEPQDEDYFQ